MNSDQHCVRKTEIYEIIQISAVDSYGLGTSVQTSVRTQACKTAEELILQDLYALTD